MNRGPLPTNAICRDEPTMNIPDLQYMPALGRKTDFPIGVVGAGGIVEAAHLPAYQKAGFTVAGIFDLIPERAERLAAQFAIRKDFRRLDDMLRDPEIEIIDIAVLPSAQVSIAAQALYAGKHVLCQKPLAESLSEAKLLVAIAAAENRQLVVNENMRWDPAMRASRYLIGEGWIGSPVLSTLYINDREDWNTWPWLEPAERLTILYDAIHPIYSFRMLFGEPSGVFCCTGRFPEQKERGETRALITMEYPNQLIGFILDHSKNPTGDDFATFRFEGTEGSIKGTLGSWYNYPVGRADTLEFSSKTRTDGFWVSKDLEGRWIPDAFVGPMGALMNAIEKNEEPENSGREHLKTLQIVEAAYRSASEGRMVAPQEFC